MQNQYNNYLKRQKQQPINNFKEKVRNSLNGKTVNNTTMPNTNNPVANKLRANMNIATQGSANQSKSVQPTINTNTQQIVTTPPNTQQTPQNTIVNEAVPLTNLNGEVAQANIEVTDTPIGGQGLMSLSDINNSISVPVNEVVPPKARIVENANARSANTTNANNYKDILEQNRLDQIAQADKNWQIQEEAFNQQMDVLNSQYEQSKADAENAYNDSVNKLNENRYNQMEDLNVSGTNRGIQYSPQQLGLENVANINHNKNLVETSKQRNELLNKLQIEMNNSLAQLNMTMVNARNEYNKNILDINTNYANTLVGWGREDALTQDSRDWEQKLLEEKRKWEEAQAQKDREFQQMMQDLQNKFDREQQNNQNNWQSGENALDREHDKTLANMSKSRSGGGYSNYSRSYSPYSRSYNPYSRSYYDGYQNYDGGSVDLSDDINARAYIATANEYSDDDFDAYNSLMSPYNADSRASAYRTRIDEMIDFAKQNGADNETMRSLYNTRDRAVKQMFENHSGYKNYGGDAIKRGDDKVKFYQKHVTNSLDRMKANQAESVMKKMRNTKKEDKKDTSKSNNKSNNTKQNKTVEKVKKSVSNSAKNLKKNTNTKEASKKIQKAIANSNKNVKKSLNNAKKNVKKSTENAKKNVKKSVANSKKNVKKSTNNAMKNLKKNIGKLFGKK